MQQTRSLYLLWLLRYSLQRNSVSKLVVSPTLKMSSTLKRHAGENGDEGQGRSSAKDAGNESRMKSQ